MSSKSKSGFSSANINESPEEESGWTAYFEDFFNNHNKSSSSISSVVHNYNSSSLVSDATSLNLAAKKVAYSDDQTREDFSVNKNVSFSTTNFMKRKKAHASVNLIVDDVLQDTATSPLVTSLKKGSCSDRKEMDSKGRHNT